MYKKLVIQRGPHIWNPFLYQILPEGRGEQRIPAWIQVTGRLGESPKSGVETNLSRPPPRRALGIHLVYLNNVTVTVDGWVCP